MIPYNVSDRTITFFARGRPWSVGADHAGFDAIRAVLLAGDADPDILVALADVRTGVVEASQGQLEFVGDDLVYGGEVLHNVWVDKILGFKERNEAFDPVFRALEDLQRNPTPAARERLPLFVERSGLGFLPDGRIAAFKGVRASGYDVHSNTVFYAIGHTVSMDRALCDPDPAATCRAGLHLGAIDYIERHGYGWGDDRKMLLCAFWPRHAVAVPVDYKGGKLRVESLEVLDEVSKEYVDELLKNGTTVIRGYEPIEPEPDVYDMLEVGDWITVDDKGPYRINIARDQDGDRHVTYLDYWLDQYPVERDDPVEILESPPPIWLQVRGGSWVRVQDDPVLRDGLYEVSSLDDETQEEADQHRYTVNTPVGEVMVMNRSIVEVLDAGAAKGEIAGTAVV